jgi:hypothetical protein
MTKPNWIFPNPNAGKAVLQAFETESMRTRTNFKPHDLETEIGRLNLFLFTPDHSMSINADYGVYEDWSSTFEQMCTTSKMSKQMGCLTCFDLWKKAKNQQEAATYFPVLIASLCPLAGLDLVSEDFVELKRVTIFCTPKPDNNGFDVSVLIVQR